MSIKSHIAESCFMIKNFRINEIDGDIVTLNLKDFEVKHKGYKEIGKKKGYYTDEVENYLKREFEDPASLIISNLKKNIGTPTVLSNKEKETLDYFATILFCRNPNIYRKSYENSIAFELGISVTHSDIIKLVDRTNIKEEFFSSRYPIILDNQTDKSFVSSIFGFAIIPTMPLKFNIFIPLSPKLALLYVELAEFKTIYQESSNAYTIHIDDIEFFNGHILDYAINQFKEASTKDKDLDIYYLFSNDEEEINRLKEIAKIKIQNGSD